MKKRIFLLLIMLALFASTTPICAETMNTNVDANQIIVEELLDDFYSFNSSGIEINYGDSLVDEKVRYYNDTYEMYNQQDYSAILNYNIENNISVVKTITPILSVLSIATRPINKSVSKTYSMDAGNTFQYGTVTVTFTGSYTYHTGDEEITGLTATSSVSKPSNFAISNSSFNKSYTDTVITLKRTMDITITLTTGMTIDPYYNQVFKTTINAN